MRILIFLFFLSCIVCCRTNGLRIPDQPVIKDLAVPIFLRSDTTSVSLNDYFSFPEKIKKINPALGIKINWDKTEQRVTVIRVDTGALLSDLNIRYEGYDYNIPVILEKLERQFYIRTDEVKGDTIFLQSSSPVESWSVYFQNYKLPENFLVRKGERVGIVLPEIVGRLKYGKLRIWAMDGVGGMSDIVVPLKKGKLITEVGQLCPTDERTAIIYAMDVGALKEIPLDSMEKVYHNPEIGFIGQKIEKGYFKELGVNTLYLFSSASNDSLPADIEKLTEEARHYKIDIIEEGHLYDTLGQSNRSYSEKMDCRVYDQAVVVFAHSNMGFNILAQLLEAHFQYGEEDNARIHFSGNHNKARFITRTDEYKTLAATPNEQQDTVYQKLMQFLAFNATIPGVPMIYCGDEIAWIKRECPFVGLDEINEGQLSVKSKLGALNKLRSENMALLYGDFVPLRVENQIYAYLRTYFDKNVLVVFNKGQETVSLKLDLPRMNKEKNFHSLFGNRFSYDNSRIILDVPANGVEIIYNE